jgi:tripartite-type tricarboxylate transporter receptor subunit TctC
MKYIISIVLMFFSNAYASQVVPIVWPFSPGSNQANAIRKVIENANASQSKYVFVFENKPGAGGSIAVNHVIQSSTPALLATTTSFFVRPRYYPNQSHDVNAIQPVVIMATNGPLVLMSTKMTSVEELKKKSSIRIGIIQGSITESLARTLQKNLNNDVVLVPYQGTINATSDMIGGHIDASIEFIKDALPFVEANRANIVGITGNSAVDKHKTFESQGIKDTTEIVNNYYIAASVKMSESLVKELYEILSIATQQQNVVDFWKSDSAISTKRSYRETVEFWNNTKNYWK